MLERLKRLNQKFLPGRQFYGPEWLVLGVNNVCNLHCKMCDVGLVNLNTNFAQNLIGTHPRDMPLELVTHIQDQAARYYPSVRIGYAFTEPLIYPHLIEALDHARSKGLFTSVTTNGLTLPKRADDLVGAGTRELSVSLDGLKETHNFIRGNRRSFQSALDGIERILTHAEDSRPTISIFCVITDWNYSDLKTFADFFSGYPLKQLGFMHTNYTPKEVARLHNRRFGDRYLATDSNLGEIDLSRIEFEALREQVDEIRATNYPFPVTFSPELRTVSDLQTFYGEPGKLIGSKCNDVFTNIMIKSDGSVIPAHGRCYQLNIGNLYEHSLRDIWNSSVLSQFRRDLAEAGGLFPACSRCCSAF